MTEPVTIGRATHIYALCDERGVVRYIGKTVRTPKQRFAQHKTASKTSNLPVGRWLRKHPKASVRVLEVVEAGCDWAAREAFWIEQHENLLNLTAGGEGLAGHVFSEEHRRKIAEGLRSGEDFNCKRCGTAFYRKRNQIAKGQNKYCSRKCYQVHGNARTKPVSKETIEAGRLATIKRHANQTHCKRGHPLSGDNLFLTSAGSRGCKECRKIHKAKYRGRSHG